MNGRKPFGRISLRRSRIMSLEQTLAQLTEKKRMLVLREDKNVVKNYSK